MTFDGCKFTKYDNTVEAKCSSPVYIVFGYKASGHIDTISMHSFTFINNEVYGSLPVKIENVGIHGDSSIQSFTPVIKVLDNYFDISSLYKSGAKDNRKMGFMIRPYKSDVKFILYDDGNTKSNGTTAIYAVDDDQTEFFKTKGIKILDRNGRDKEIQALEFKSTNKWIALKSVTE